MTERRERIEELRDLGAGFGNPVYRELADALERIEALEKAARWVCSVPLQPETAEGDDALSALDALLGITEAP